MFTFSYKKFRITVACVLISVVKFIPASMGVKSQAGRGGSTVHRAPNASLHFKNTSITRKNLQ